MDGTTLDGEVLRRAIGTLLPSAGGIVTPGGLAVAQQGTPNMSVQIAAGECWVAGQSAATQGLYYSRNGVAATLAVPASDPSKPRVDQIVVQIQDAAYAGAGKLCQPFLIQGTPTTGAALNNLVGLGTFPPANSSALLLAYVLVPALATSIITANISNVAGGAGWTAPNLVAGWTTAPTTLGPLRYRIIGGGAVQFEGAIANGTGGTLTNVVTAGNWPAAATPPYSRFCSTTTSFNQVNAIIVSHTNGVNMQNFVAAGDAVYFDNVQVSLL